MDNSNFNSINPVFVKSLCILLPIMAAIACAITGLWLLAGISILMALIFYIASMKSSYNARKLLICIIIISLSIYPSLFAFWGWHLISVIFIIFELLLAFFLAKSELIGKLFYSIISFFFVMGVVNIIENANVGQYGKLTYCVIFNFVIFALLLARAILLKRRA